MPQDATRSCGISDFEALLSRGIHFPERSDRKENPRPVFSFHHRTSVKYLRLWQMIGQVSQNGKPLLHRVYEEKSVNKNFYDNSWLVSI